MIELRLKSYTLKELKILRSLLYYADDKCVNDCGRRECSNCVKYKCCRDIHQALVFLDNRINFMEGHHKNNDIVK